MAFLREQIRSQGRGAHPLKGTFRYDLGDDIEIVIGKVPDDPDGLDWSQLQTIVGGLWEYIVTGMRYRTVSFDILLVKWEAGSLSERTVKRGVQLSSLTPPSSANLTSGQRSPSLSAPLGGPIDWPVKNTDMTLRFSTFGSGPQNLDREAVNHLFIDVISIVDNGIAAHGDQALFNADVFHHGGPVQLDVINWRHKLTWGQLAAVVLGLIDFMVDHEHYRSWYFSIYVLNPKVDIGLGIITKDVVLGNNNLTVARRSSRKSRNGVGEG